jgi:hypothetical protein
VQESIQAINIELAGYGHTVHSIYGEAAALLQKLVGYLLFAAVI